MEKIFIGPEQVFGADFPVIPIYMGGNKDKKDQLIGFGLVWRSQVVPINGYQNLLPLAIVELQRERPGICWEP